MRIFISTLLAGCLIGCVAEAPQPQGPVAEQLERSNQHLAARDLPLRIVGYAAAAPLETEAAVRAVEQQLVDAGALVPRYDGMAAASFSLSTIGERMQAFRAGEDAQDVVANIEAMAFPGIEVGQQVMDLTWESGGRQFHTQAVYDEDGIVYDNILSNLAVVTAGEPASETALDRSRTAAAKDGGVTFANEAWSTRFLDLTILWIWGGTRGKIEMDHYVISCDGWYSFCDDGGAVNAWMSLGSAAGETGRNALVYPRISKLAWGYGWATPTASFSINWSFETLTFSVTTSGVGSAGKGSGIHTIY